jgi:hypothetical protein
MEMKRRRGSPPNSYLANSLAQLPLYQLQEGSLPSQDVLADVAETQPLVVVKGTWNLELHGGGRDAFRSSRDVKYSERGYELTSTQDCSNPLFPRFFKVVSVIHTHGIRRRVIDPSMEGRSHPSNALFLSDHGAYLQWNHRQHKDSRIFT